MDCQQALEAISADLDGELTPAERAQLEDHLARCPHCRALREELAALHAACPAALEAEAPPELRQAVLSHLPPRRAGRTGAVRWLRWGAMAAAAAVALLALWRLPHALPHSAETAQPAPAVADSAPLPAPAAAAGGQSAPARNETFSAKSSAQDKEGGTTAATARSADSGSARAAGTADAPAAQEPEGDQNAKTVLADRAEPVPAPTALPGQAGRGAAEDATAPIAVFHADGAAPVAEVPEAEAAEAAQADGEADFSSYRAVVTWGRAVPPDWDYPSRVLDSGEVQFLLPASALPDLLADGSCQLRDRGEDLTPESAYLLVVVPAPAAK